MDVDSVDVARLAGADRTAEPGSESDGADTGHRSRTTKSKQHSRRSKSKRKRTRSKDSRRNRSRSERRKESAASSAARRRQPRFDHNENMDVSPEKQLAILNEMEKEIVRMRESINLAVSHCMPDIKKLLARVKLAETALNNLKTSAEDVKNFPTVLRSLKSGTDRLLKLEAQYQEARASSSVLRSPYLPRPGV